MIVLKLAIRNLFRNRRSSIVLLGLVAVGVFLFVIGDSVLGSATAGMSKSFQESYTADIAIRARFERKFGIFGFNVPTIGEYEEIPTLPEAARIGSLLEADAQLAGSSALVSGAALLDGPGGYQEKVPVFGVQAASYFPLFPGLVFVSGSAPKTNEAWIVLSRNRADELEKRAGRPLAIGESLQLTMASGSAFSIRAVRLAGIVTLPGTNLSEASPAYIDAGTLRSLLGLAGGKAQKDKGGAASAVQIDVDQELASMFSSEPAGATTTAGQESGTGQSGATGLALAESYLAADSTALTGLPPETADSSASAGGAWHFILARAVPGTNVVQAIRAINRNLKAEGIQAEAVGWLSVAGLNAGILALLKIVFEIGMVVLAGVIILVLANGLAFSVIEQTREIGSTRAMGAQKAFVRTMYFIQALVIVLSGSLVGLGLGWAALRVLSLRGIHLGNSYLSMLFGGDFLRPAFVPGAAGLALVGAIVVAAVSSIYPMVLADRTSVAATMQAE